MSRRGFKVPHTLVLLFAMVVVALVATYVLPQGQFERVTTADGHALVQAGTYTRLTEPVVLQPLTVLTAIPRGLIDSADIIFFCFVIGGAIAVIRETGAIDAVLGLVLRRFGHRPSWLVAAGIIAFALGASTLGMAEEYLPLVPLLLALCTALRLDAVTAIGIMVVGYGTGYGAAAINPFTVIVAQEIAGLAPTSGLGYRLVLLVVFVSLGIHHVLRYARRVRADPSQSLVADQNTEPPPAASEQVTLTSTHAVVLGATFVAVAILVYGIAVWEWYLVEMSAVFLGLTVVVGIVGRVGADGTAVAFCRGAEELTTTALLIGVARAVKIVLEDGMVIDTIIDGIATPLSALGPELSATGMLVIQCAINFFIPSGSGQAYVTMPIMAPIAGLTGVSRQVAVLAYQFGDGFMNMVVPTNAVLVGILGMGKIPYDRWLRFIAPLMAKIVAAGAAALVVAVWIGYS